MSVSRIFDPGSSEDARCRMAGLVEIMSSSELQIKVFGSVGRGIFHAMCINLDTIDVVSALAFAERILTKHSGFPMWPSA